MKYKGENIKVIKAEEHVIKNQKMYFGSRGANPEEICSAIAEGALILGATETNIKNHKGWWLVSSEVDWLKLPSIIEIDEKSIFERFYGFPEAGVNWHRSEIMAKIFSECCFTVAYNDISLVSGEMPESNTLKVLKEYSSKWARTIVFKFIKKA